MAKDPRRLFTWCCLAAAGTGLPCEANEADANPIVLVQVENPHGLEAPHLDRAQELATEIYERAGVLLGWTPDETMEPDRTITLS